MPYQNSLWELFTQDGTDSQNLGAWLMDKNNYHDENHDEIEFYLGNSDRST